MFLGPANFTFCLSKSVFLGSGNGFLGSGPDPKTGIGLDFSDFTAGFRGHSRTLGMIYGTQYFKNFAPAARKKRHSHPFLQTHRLLELQSLTGLYLIFFAPAAGWNIISVF